MDTKHRKPRYLLCDFPECKSIMFKQVINNSVYQLTMKYAWRLLHFL